LAGRVGFGRDGSRADVEGLDEDAAVGFAHDSVAGHEQPDVSGDVDGIVGESRVARPEDQVALDVDLEFAFKGRSDFDLGERPEALRCRRLL